MDDGFRFIDRKMERWKVGKSEEKTEGMKDRKPSKGKEMWILSSSCSKGRKP